LFPGAPRRGGFTEIVERTGGGLLVEPDNVERLTEGLHTLWRDPALRATLARQGYEGVRAQYTVQRATDRALAVYDEVIRATRSPGAKAVSNRSSAVR
jgi:glycosyltransferase involved in cell wall biosynthesis